MAALLTLLLIFLSTQGKFENQMNPLLPKELSGWRTQGVPAFYDRETLYDYINGAAEIYLTYSFKNVLVQRYAKKNNPGILIEIFDMDRSEDAFGIFSHTQGRGDEVGVGQNSDYQRGLLCFWKDKYFVCIRAEKENERVKKVILGFAKKISNAIKLKGEQPYLITILDLEDFDRKSIRYFHKHEILDYHFFVADQNILHLNERTNAVLAKYANNKSQLLIIQYPTAVNCKSAQEDFTKMYFRKPEKVIQTENGKWTAVGYVNNFLFIIFDADSKADALKKKEKAERRLGK